MINLRFNHIDMGRGSSPSSPNRPSEFGVLLSVDERLEENRKNLLGVAVRSNQTLAEFKTQVLEKHGIDLSEYTLILIGRELKDDQKTLDALGMISGCTVHAGEVHPQTFVTIGLKYVSSNSLVANIQFSLTTFNGEEYPMVASPITRISDVRKMVQDVDTEELPWDALRLTLNGVDNLRETQTLWDLDILSGATFTLRQFQSFFLRE